MSDKDCYMCGKPESRFKYNQPICLDCINDTLGGIAELEEKWQAAVSLGNTRNHRIAVLRQSVEEKDKRIAELEERLKPKGTVTFDGSTYYPEDREAELLHQITGLKGEIAGMKAAVKALKKEHEKEIDKLKDLINRHDTLVMLGRRDCYRIEVSE